MGESTYRERPGGVTGCCPAPAAVQTEALVGDDPEQTTTPESLRVGLALDLEHVERQQDDLTNANQRTSSRVHDGLAVALAECLVEGVAVVSGEVVACEGLSAVLVDALEDLWSIVRPCCWASRNGSYLVCSGVSETREQRQEATADRGIGGVPEDDLVQVRRRLDLADVAHEALRCGVDGVEDHELSETGASCTILDTISHAPSIDVPAPRNRAVLDSRLYSLADELVPAATWATFATASDGVGDIAKCAEERETMQLEGPRSQTRRDTANGYRRRTEATR